MNFVAQQSRRTRPKVYAAILGALFLTPASPLVLAHSGHGDEFKGTPKRQRVAFKSMPQLLYGWG